MITDFAIKNETLVTYIGDDSEITIPDGVKIIGKAAFKGNKIITNVTIPNSVTQIESNAFCDCKNLLSVNIPCSVEKIGSSAFKNCENLTSIVIPDSVKAIGICALKNCINLTDVVLPSGMKTIPESMFAECWRLKNISIPDGVTEIGKNAFEFCRALSAIKLPNGLKCIGSNAFLNCFSLKCINIPEGVSKISWGAFASCGFNDITIPGNIKHIDSCAFQDCKNLTCISFLNGVEKISHYAFSGCLKLTSITFPESLVFIENRAFDESSRSAGVRHYCYHFDACKNLICVTLPNRALNYEFCEYYGSKGLKFKECEKLNDVEGLTLIRSSTFTSIMGGSKDAMLESVKSLNALGINELTIYAPSGSFAQTYAEQNNIPFLETPKDKYIKIFCSKDYVEKMESFVNKYKFPQEFFNDVFLNPAIEAKAKKCIDFLKKWKKENL